MVQRTLDERVEWLEGIVGVYGHLLGVKGHTITNVLRSTIGSLLWLNGLNDDEWQVLWDEIVSVLLCAAEKRGVS